jgi:hypothetical protein
VHLSFLLVVNVEGQRSVQEGDILAEGAGSRRRALLRVHYIKPSGAAIAGKRSCKIYRRLNKGSFCNKSSFPVRRRVSRFTWGVGDLTGKRHDDLASNLFWSDASVDAVACSVGIFASRRSARGDLAAAGELDWIIEFAFPIPAANGAIPSYRIRS